MIRPPGVDHGALVVLSDLVWYARGLLLFSATSQTGTWSKTFECALVSTLETYDDPEHGNYCHYCTYWHNFVFLDLLSLMYLLHLLELFRFVGFDWFSNRI